MLKLRKYLKIISIILISIIMNILIFNNAVIASNIEKADIQSIKNCGHLLKYKGIIVETFYAEYENNNKKYPAYCLDKTKKGVSESNPTYEVSVEDAIKDVNLWRILINGYPYKTIEELGVANKEEAFTATKQAVYTYLHGNELNSYEAIGEAGQRTLNALYKIVNDANNSKEMQISNKINIESEQENWLQDSIKNEYVYKIYNINSSANIDNYKVNIKDENDKMTENIIIADEYNKIRNEFKSNEKFKILIPIQEMKENKKFEIEIEGKVKTKPILYGKAHNSKLQDYALTASTYEDGEGKKIETYNKNYTKIIILKQDEETGEKMNKVEFQLLDKNKNVIYTNLETNEYGIVEIENLIPDKYYIKEINTNDGYEIYNDLIEIELNLNEELMVKVNNKKKEEPIIKKIKNEKEVKYQKILPITGM